MVVAAVTAAALLAPLVGPAPAAAQPPAPAGFSDVSPGSHKPAIDALDQMGVFEGTLCGENRFCPSSHIDRSTMAVWLIRVLESGDPPDTDASGFADVDSDQWWAPFVERIADLEITVGCKREPLRYCPDELVTRARMATFLERAFDLDPADPVGFVDIAGSTHEANINALAASKLTVGCKKDPLSFCPNTAVSRAQMATFLHRAFNLLTFKATSAGGAHSCAIRTDETIRCWGSNQHGQMNAPQGTFRSVSAGGSHTCGLGTDETTRCWGHNEFGQTDAPKGAFIGISAGGSHTCGIRTNNWIQCWGRNQWLQREAPPGNYRAVSAGGGHSCAIRTDGTIRCWGNDDFGQSVSPHGSYRAVAAGGNHSCAIRTDGTVRCWGTNNWGERNAPEGTFSAISLGARHSCGLQTDGVIRCWGHNDFGQTDAPRGVFSAIASGEAHSCAIGSDDTVYCWGRYNGGQASRPQ